MTEYEATTETDSYRDAEPVDDWRSDGVPPSVAIVEAVADATGRDPTELPPIQESVDGDALDVLLAPRTENERRLRLEFAYDDVHVTVWRDGTIDVES